MATILDSREARMYREAAVAFCALVENRDSHPALEWLKSVHLLLPCLYAATLALPRVVPDTENAGERTITHDDWQALYTDLTDRLGRWDSYFDVSDPYDEASHEPVRISLADDLADIYRDVKNGLLAEQAVAGARPNDVLWTWRFEFESHWAAHAAGALRALQTALLVHYAERVPETFRSRAAGGEPDAGKQQDEPDGASRRTLS